MGIEFSLAFNLISLLYEPGLSASIAIPMGVLKAAQTQHTTILIMWVQLAALAINDQFAYLSSRQLCRELLLVRNNEFTYNCLIGT